MWFVCLWFVESKEKEKEKGQVAGITPLESIRVVGTHLFLIDRAAVGASQWQRQDLMGCKQPRSSARKQYHAARLRRRC